MTSPSSTATLVQKLARGRGAGNAQDAQLQPGDCFEVRHVRTVFQHELQKAERVRQWKQRGGPARVQVVRHEVQAIRAAQERTHERRTVRNGEFAPPALYVARQSKSG